ncbi:MAG: T9SS type A sorting domain-containing protein [Crocinitomicaceae bacterium]|nr:T9SS type A sorting domain-containing protein [Crocinitomicaceae bacterium]
MKTILLNFNLTITLALFIAMSANAQVPKNLVVVEKFSGVNCGACPEAVHQIHDLIDNQNAQMAVISYQTGGYSIPLYDNSDSQGRHSYYASLITGYPTTIFGGQHVASFNVTQDYVNHYNNEIAELSPVGLSASYTDNGNGNITVNSVITQEASTGSNLKLMIAITETKIDQDWMTESVLYDVNRKMLPNNNGTSISFSSSNTLNNSSSFTIDPSWDRDYLSAVVFVQNSVTKEIVQGAKISLADNSNTVDAMVDNIYFDTDLYCGGTMSPLVRIRNSGSQNLQSVKINYSIAGESSFYDWTGNLAPFEQEDVQLPQITFIPSTSVTMNVSTSNPNGTNDQDVSNDLTSQIFTHSVTTGSTPSLEMRTDGFAIWYTQWKIVDDQGTIVEQAGMSDWQEFTLYEYDFDLADGCYEFIISDDTGNGFVDWTTGPGQINSGEENGYFKFFDDQGNLISEGVDFGYELKVPFKVGEDVDVSGIENHGDIALVKLYPNPSLGAVTIEYSNESAFNVVIMNAQGKVVMSPKGSFSKTAQLDLSDLNAGYYFVTVSDSDFSTIYPLLVK